MVLGSLEVNSGKTEASLTRVTVDNHSDDNATIIHVDSPNKAGTFQIVTSSLKELGLQIVEALVDSAEGLVSVKFHATDSAGHKIRDAKDARNIEAVVLTALNNSLPAPPVNLPGLPTTIYAKPDEDLSDIDLRSKTQLLYRLMDTYLQNDVFSLQSSIMDHVEYTIARSRFNFDDFEAYMVV